MENAANDVVISEDAKPGGKRPTEAERFERLGIVEQCIVEGTSSRAEIRDALAKAGRPGIADRTIDGYCKIVRERRAAERDEDRAVRRSHEISAAYKMERVILGLLLKHKVVPTWRDLQNAKALRIKVEGLDAKSDLRGTVDDEMEEHNAEQLDELMLELLERSESAIRESEEIETTA